MKWSGLITLACISMFLAACLFVSNTFASGSIQVKSFKLAAVKDGYTVSIDSSIELNPTLAQALEKGVVLYFVNKFTLVEPRWYWFDKEVARIKTRIGLRYHALTRQYRLTDKTSSKNFSSLKDALLALQRVRDHPLRIKHEMKPNVQYVADLRLLLDLTRMPKPFQVEALGSSAWNLSSEKLEWRMTLPSPEKPFQLFVGDQ